MIYPYGFGYRDILCAGLDKEIFSLPILYYHILEIVRTLFYHQTNIVNLWGYKLGRNRRG